MWRVNLNDSLSLFTQNLYLENRHCPSNMQRIAQKHSLTFSGSYHAMKIYILEDEDEISSHMDKYFKILNKELKAVPFIVIGAPFLFGVTKWVWLHFLLFSARIFAQQDCSQQEPASWFQQQESPAFYPEQPSGWKSPHNVHTRSLHPIIFLLKLSPNELFGNTKKDVCAKMFIPLLFTMERKSKCKWTLLHIQQKGGG